MNRSIRTSAFFAGLLFAAAIIHVINAEPIGAPATKPSPGKPADLENAKAHVHVVPEAMDDISWENDRIAFRIYGPALAKNQPTGSGIDVWVKSTRKMITDKWYKLDNYDVDHGEGLDFYSVDAGRGCGGLGVWNGKSLDVSTVWQSYKIIADGPESAVFEVNYADWKSGDRIFRERRIVTLKAGSNLNRIVSTIESDKPGIFTVAVGVSLRKSNEGEAQFFRKKGVLSYWQPPDLKNGTIGVGLIVNPKSLVKFTTTIDHHLALIQCEPGKPFVYYCGAGWSKSGDFADEKAWHQYMQNYEPDFTVK